MNALFINACMRPESRTHQLCRAYIEKHWSGSETDVQEVIVKDQALKPYDQPMLEQRSAAVAARDYADPQYDHAKTFAQADVILVGAPYWDLSFPSMLKVYFEHICLNGVTFGYGPKGQMGLCKAKKLVYITTSGGYIRKPNSLEAYLHELCAMFGIQNLKIHKAEGLDIHGNDPQAILARAMAEL